jgi:hypothetical protein
MHVFWLHPATNHDLAATRSFEMLAFRKLRDDGVQEVFEMLAGYFQDQCAS